MDNDSVRGRLICVGDLMLDVLVVARHLEDGMPDGIHLRPGGSAANTAVWAALEGFPTAWLGSTGTGPMASMLLDDLRRYGVLPIPQRVADGQTGVVISRIGKLGNRVMHSARWASSIPLSVESITRLEGASGLHVTAYAILGGGGNDVWESVSAVANRDHSVFSFDPSDRAVIDRIGRDRLLGWLESRPVDVIFANVLEARHLTGRRAVGDCITALRRFAELVILKRGPKGCDIAFQNESVHIAAEPVDPVDTTGAGDAFAGAWLAHYLKGQDPVSSCQAGTRAAATAIRSIGSRPDFAG